MKIIDLDPHDDAAFDAWHAAYLEAESASGAASAWQLEELRVLLQEQSQRYLTLGWSGLVDGRVVGGYEAH